MRRTTTSTTDSQQHGSENSYATDSSRQDSLTSAALRTCSQATSPDTRSAISSPASGAGVTRCVSQASETMSLFGLDHAPANHSAPPEKAKASTIPVISGRRGFGSSESAALQHSLESRLRAGMASLGSTLFRLTWKRRLTPSGRRIFALRGSARRISGNACTSWATPTSRDGKDGASDGTVPTNGLLGRQAWMAPWPSPDASGFEAKDLDRLSERRQECKERTGNGNGFGLTLGQAVPLLLSPWPTPQAHDQHGPNSDQVAGEYATNGTTLGGAARLALGQNSHGSRAETASSGQLNPAFPLWLQGYPDEWASSAALAIASARKSPRNSSRRR